MKAIVLDGKSHAYTLERPVPEIGEGYALVKVMAAGICGTDIEVLYHSPKQSDIIPGHEVAGVVEKTNACRDFKAGDRVFLNCHITCHDCEPCEAGDFIFCKQLKCIGFEVDGGDAEYIAIPEVNLRKLPDDITFEQGVLLTDALGTPFHAAKKADIHPGEFVGVSGAGPLGIMCILCAAHLEGTVVAIDIVEERLEASKQFGAAYTVNARGDVKAEIERITNGRGLDKVIDCSGSAMAIKTDLAVLKNRGTLVQVGVCPSITLDLYESVVAKEITVRGSRNFHDTEADEMIGLIRSTKNINDVISHRFGFNDAQKAFELAEQRKGIKIVFVPDDCL